ncbi:hypothetical protein [Parasitella parasitica]|uniref:Reverse transcriptase domain-containing protein n=1 Tax=Parasitella parasitica TaxID=35722 RepID=A0A0B7N045_9FUNG|nr:hypothetical protein [Parasitella parasitica]
MLPMNRLLAEMACRINLSVSSRYIQVVAKSHLPLSTMPCLLLTFRLPGLSRNWRPIALINTDAKVFTRILSARMADTASSLINPYQTGFVRGRFIADNGMLMKLVMEHAKSTRSSSIGLLLDQEKAYDRVHPVYLRAVLLRFGYPVALVNCISRLFFDNHMVINVNGFLSPPVSQLRGLKQGDPISPILFNLAFEPLLRRIMADSSLAGFSLPSPVSTQIPTNVSSTAVKMLAYADDIVCLLNSPSDLSRLQQHLQLYAAASNAKVNYHKTEAISLSGSPRIYGSIWRSALHRHNITSWHDARSPSPVRYLGFPLYTSIAQRDVFLKQLLETIQQGCLIHQQRGLSVRGRATVLNSLLLSKLWHVLRVVTVPVSFFQSINSAMSSFLNFRIFPRISVNTACLPRSQGGIGLIHPQLQQSALQLRWLRPLLDQSTADILCCPSIVLPRLVGFLLSHQPLLSDLFRSPPQQLDHRFSLLFPRPIDQLPKDFSNLIVSASTCLEIPLESVILTSSSSVVLGRSMAQLPSSVAYTQGTDSGSCLRPKQTSELTVHPILAKRFLKFVRQDEIKLAPFYMRAFIDARFSSLGRFPFQHMADHTVVDITPFVESLHFSSSTTTGLSRRALSTKTYRRLCRPAIPHQPPLPPPFSPDVSVNWFDFWLLPITHSCRNIWYRFLHQKIPHKSLLHRFVPDFFPTPSCAICSHPTDTLDHFLFSCPIKLSVWQTIQHRHLPFLSTPWASFDLHLLLTTVRFPTEFPRSALLVIAATLESIWISHWSFIFSDTPFTLDSVLSIAESKILKYQQESFIIAGIPHCPLPFFSVD